MKSKAPLVMMEQIVMVLVFALAAALCLQTYVLSGVISKRTEAKNRAVVEAQNVAETMKNGGFNEYLDCYDPEQRGTVWCTLLSADWQITKEESLAEYVITVSYEESDTLCLWLAEIILEEADGEELVRLSTAGQTEVLRNE